MFKDIVKSSNYLLNTYYEANDCLNYLNSRLTKFNQNFFEFGYFPNSKNISILSSLIGEKILLDNKLIFYREFEDSCGKHKMISSYFENYPLIMPYKDIYGNIIALIGRTLLSDDNRIKNKISKYKTTSFIKGNHLFGLNEAKKYIIDKNFIFIVEGQFDVAKANENGIKNIVALGGSSLTNYQAGLIARYTKNICLLLDNDDAGIKGRILIHNKFDKFFNIKDFYLPQGYKDIDEYFTNNTLDNFKFILRNYNL